jgi:hypothetical protein
MPKINVYLPDDLAESVRETNLPVSAICQRVLEQAVKRVIAIRQTAAADLLGEADDPVGQARFFTARSLQAVQLGIDRARTASATNVGTGDLWAGIVAEGSNLALRIASTLEIDPTSIQPAATAEPGGGEGLRFSNPAATVLELAVTEAIALGHNYVGCEHLLIALVSEPDGVTGKALRAAGADVKTVRQTVIAVLAGYAHLRQTTPAKELGNLMAAVRQELRPLVERIERLEARQN